MDNREYWEQRENEARAHYLTEEADIERKLEQIYTSLQADIMKEINSFYQKYATAEGITMAEAMKRVDKMDVKAFSAKAKKYVETKDFSPQANTELRLYNATMKINRLELLKANIGLEMVDSFSEVEDIFDESLTQRAIDEYERQAGILGTSARNTAETARSIVNTSFNNATFSERIWKYQGQLKNQLSSLLANGLIQGIHSRVLAKDVMQFCNKTRAEANRLLHTEMARVQTAAQEQSYKDNGIDQYVYIAEPTACSICAKLDDGIPLMLSKMQVGTNAPPMHPNCRCSTAAYVSRDNKNPIIMMRSGISDKSARTVFKNARFKTDDEDIERYIDSKRLEDTRKKIDITTEWTSHNGTGSYVKSNSITVEGAEYTVDGKYVVLDPNPNEIKIGKLLSEKYNYNVVTMPRVVYPQGISAPDYLIDGEKFDLKSPIGAGKNTLDGMLKGKERQSSNFIFDVSRCGLNEEEIVRQITNIYRSYRRLFVDKIVLIKGDEVIKVYKRKRP